MSEKKKKNVQEPQPAEQAAPAESFGRYLMRERELRGVSLEQIADKTRIWITNLKALEADDMKMLPERVFVIGYIRSYAQCIGINPDEAVLRFEEQYKEEPEEVAFRAVRRGSNPLVPVAIVGAMAVLGVIGWLVFG